MIRITDKKLNGWSKDIAESSNMEQQNNKNFFAYYKYVFDKCLTDSDIQALKGKNKNVFNFSTLRPFVLHGLKGVKDSIPTVTFSAIDDNNYDDHEDLSNEEIADIINEKSDEIFNASHFTDVVYNIAQDQYIGGKAIFKVHTDYVNNYDFTQTFFIEHVQNPTTVFFDHAAKHVTCKDARWCAQKIPIPEKKFKKMFPNVDVDQLKNKSSAYSSSDFSWIESNTNQSREKIINVMDYYYIKHDNKKVYLNQDGEITDEIPEGSDYQTRTINDKSVWRIQYCGTEVLETAKKTAFKDLPFILVPAESFLDENGKLVYIPYAKHGFDAMRTKNFIMNYYLSAVLNNPIHALRFSEDAQTDSLMDAAASLQDGKMQIYKSSQADELTGQSNAVPPVVDVPAPPLPNELLQAADELDKSLTAIFGTQFPSLDDLNNVSGKALYNLAQYISASTEILMQNLLEGIVQVGEVIKNAMPSIIQPKLIEMANTATQQEKQVIFEYMFTPSRYKVIGHRGVSNQLQKEANFENLVGLSKTIPSFGAFLEMPEVMEQLLEMLDLQNEPKWLKLWEEYQQKQAEQAQNMANQPQPGAIDPQMVQIESTKAQAASIGAQAKMKDAETRAQMADITAQDNTQQQALAAGRLQEDQRKTDLKVEMEGAKLTKDYRIDTAKLNQKHKIDLLNHIKR